MATRRQRARALAHDEGVPDAFSSPACYLHEFTPGAAAGKQPARAAGVGIKRIYDAVAKADGYRVLVDRLWPRGITRERASLDVWLTALAPSTALRTWFHRDPKRWPEFARRYRAELRGQRALLQSLRQRARRQRVTLLYAAREPRVNHAIVLRAVLQRTRTPSVSGVRGRP